MEVDARAPVQAAREAAIDAPRDLVWSILTMFEAWPTWNPDVKSARVEGPLQPGTTFRWKAGPSTITSRLEEITPPNRITWSGRTMGIVAVHVHDLSEADGQTRVRSAESWNGLLPRLLTRRMKAMLGASLESGLAALKSEAERRHRDGA